MESLYAIGLGLGLRVLVDAVTRDKPRLDGVLIGIWEGAVLNHFIMKFPTSTDPYVAFAFRLFVDFAVTASFTRLAVVVLWTGLGVVLSDIIPDILRDRQFRKFTRPLRRWLAHPHLDFTRMSSFAGSSRVRFHSDSRHGHRTGLESSGTSPAVGIAGETSPSNRTSHSRRHLPGSYQSETDTTVTKQSVTMSPVQIIIPATPFSPVPKARPTVSPGPSILSNRSVRSPVSNTHQVLSLASSTTSVVSPPLPHQLPISVPSRLPLSPPHDSPQIPPDELEYIDNTHNVMEPVPESSAPPAQPGFYATHLPEFSVPPAQPRFYVTRSTEPTNIVQPELYSAPLSESIRMPQPELNFALPRSMLGNVLEKVPEAEEPSPEPKRYYEEPDELDPLTTPPGLAKGTHIDDIDPLTTPPKRTMRTSRTRTETYDRPPSYHFLPFSSAYDNQDPLPGTESAEYPIEKRMSTSGFKDVDRYGIEEDGEQMLHLPTEEGFVEERYASTNATPPVRGDSVWNGPAKADQSIKGAPAVQEGQDSKTDTASVKGKPAWSLPGAIRNEGEDDVSEKESLKSNLSSRVLSFVRGSRPLRGNQASLPPYDNADKFAQGDLAVQRSVAIQQNPPIGEEGGEPSPDVLAKKDVEDKIVDIINPFGNDGPFTASPLHLHDELPDRPQSRIGSDSDDLIPGGQTKDALIKQADNLREEGYELEKERSNLLNESKKPVNKKNRQKLASLKEEAGILAKEAQKKHKKAVKLFLHANNKGSPVHTRKLQNLKAEEAAEEAEKIFKEATDDGASQLKFYCGSNDTKRRLTKLFKEEYKLSLTPSKNHDELIVLLPIVPPAMSSDDTNV